VSEGVRVTKMSGAGNDFLVLGPPAAAALAGRIVDWTRRVCRRGVSVGADGVLVVEPASAGHVSVRFLNPDGSPAFCGNGSRCAARYARLEGLAGDRMILDTEWGEIPAAVDRDRVTLDLPAPADLGPRTVRVGDLSLDGRLVHAGVPHFVLRVSDLRSAPLAQWGPVIRNDAALAPSGVNVDLIAGQGGEVRIRTYERGVEGETLACGSGAVAAALAHRLEGGPESVTLVPASGRPLVVTLPGSAARPAGAVLTGDARRIFDATVTAEAED
jgi:diaminopimelate epimerase